MLYMLLNQLVFSAKKCHYDLLDIFQRIRIAKQSDEELDEFLE